MSTPLWGPEETTPVAPEPPQEKRWGAGSVAMVVALLIVTQVVFAIALIAYVFATTDVDPSTPEGVDQVLQEVTDTLLSGPVLVSALVVQWVAFIGGPWLASRWFGLKSLRRDFGLRFTKADVGIGVGVGLALQAAQFVILNFLVDLSASDNTNIVTDQRGIYLVLMVLGACLVTPFAEELFFRGMILRAVMRTKPGGWWPVDEDGVPARTGRGVAVIAVVVSSVIFGVMHLTTDGSLADSLPLMLFTGSLGAVLAIVTLKTKRLGAAIIAHCLFNSVSVALALLSIG